MFLNVHTKYCLAVEVNKITLSVYNLMKFYKMQNYNTQLHPQPNLVNPNLLVYIDSASFADGRTRCLAFNELSRVSMQENKAWK